MPAMLSGAERGSMLFQLGVRPACLSRFQNLKLSKCKPSAIRWMGLVAVTKVERARISATRNTSASDVKSRTDNSRKRHLRHAKLPRASFSTASPPNGGSGTNGTMQAFRVDQRLLNGWAARCRRRESSLVADGKYAVEHSHLRDRCGGYCGRRHECNAFKRE